MSNEEQLKDIAKQLQSIKCILAIMKEKEFNITVSERVKGVKDIPDKELLKFIADQLEFIKDILKDIVAKKYFKSNENWSGRI